MPEFVLVWCALVSIHVVVPGEPGLPPTRFALHADEGCSLVPLQERDEVVGATRYCDAVAAEGTLYGEASPPRTFSARGVVVAVDADWEKLSSSPCEDPHYFGAVPFPFPFPVPPAWRESDG